MFEIKSHANKKPASADTLGESCVFIIPLDISRYLK
jgi:hypothetical protein